MDYSEDYNEPATCMCCGNPTAYIGTLGSLDWYTCPHCGMQQSQQAGADTDE